MQAGIIEEMMEETMDILEDQDELEEEAQEEVDKVNVLLVSATINVKVK
jgi:charged multivesicular body protein 3